MHKTNYFLAILFNFRWNKKKNAREMSDNIGNLLLTYRYIYIYERLCSLIKIIKIICSLDIFWAVLFLF